MSQFHIRRVAVLGAGVMGAQIAAHLVNARIPVLLFDLPSSEGPDKSAIANKAFTLLNNKELIIPYVLEVMVGKENNVFPMVPQGCSVSEVRLK